MGCDIHLNVLTRRADGWRIEAPPVNEKDKARYPKFESMWAQWPGSTRNYRQFGLMTAGAVRERVPWAKPVFPAPRGWGDLSEIGITVPGEWNDDRKYWSAPYNKDGDRYEGGTPGPGSWDIGEHSCSYLTLDDFETFESEGGWTQSFGPVDRVHSSNEVAAWLQARKYGTPCYYAPLRPYLGGLTLPLRDLERYLKLPADQRLVDDTQARLEGYPNGHLSRFHTRVEYMEAVATVCSALRKLHLTLEEFQALPDVSETLLVFNFDS